MPDNCTMELTDLFCFLDIHSSITITTSILCSMTISWSALRGNMVVEWKIDKAMGVDAAALQRDCENFRESLLRLTIRERRISKLPACKVLTCRRA